MGARTLAEPFWLPVTVVFVLLALCASPRPGNARSNRASVTCGQSAVELDSTHANFAALAFSGQSLAQVFLAPDTLVGAITVWRNAANYANASGMHLFLCTVDSSLRPLPATGVIYDGPTMYPGVSDSSFAPLRYELSPPVALPAKGHFAFAIKQEDPSCDLSFTILGDSTDSYPDGEAWTVHPFADCHALGSNVTGVGVGKVELIFRIEFCDATTATGQDTWGRLKARYR